MREECQSQEGGEHAEGGADEEWVLPGFDFLIVRGVLIVQQHEGLGADEGADLAPRGRDAVVLTADGSGGCLGCDQTDVVARAGFAEGGEDAIDDYEASDVARLV